jgi:hypothetical protein
MNNSPQPNYAPAAPTNTLAMVSLVSGILGWVLIPILASIVAIVTGHMARTQIKQSMGAEGGDGLAIAGLILGYSSVVLNCLAILVVLLLLGTGVGVGICSNLETAGLILSSDFVTSLLSN